MTSKWGGTNWRAAKSNFPTCESSKHWQHQVAGVLTPAVLLAAYFDTRGSAVTIDSDISFSLRKTSPTRAGCIVLEDPRSERSSPQ